MPFYCQIGPICYQGSIFSSPHHQKCMFDHEPYGEVQRSQDKAQTHWRRISIQQRARRIYWNTTINLNLIDKIKRCILSQYLPLLLSSRHIPLLVYFNTIDARKDDIDASSSSEFVSSFGFGTPEVTFTHDCCLFGSV